MSTLAALPFGRTRSMKTPVVVRRMRAPNGQTGLDVNVANALPMRRAVDFSGPVAIAIPTLVRDIAAIAEHLTNGARMERRIQISRRIFGRSAYDGRARTHGWSLLIRAPLARAYIR